MFHLEVSYKSILENSTSKNGRFKDILKWRGHNRGQQS